MILGSQNKLEILRDGYKYPPWISARRDNTVNPWLLILPVTPWFLRSWADGFFCFINLFYFYFWLRWVFFAARRLSLVAASWGYSSLRCASFSLRWLLLLRSTGSRCVDFSSCGTWTRNCGLRALERRFSSCGAQAWLLHGMWDLPGPGLEPVSPALAGGFLTTVPPGKPWWLIFEELKILGMLTHPY